MLCKWPLKQAIDAYSMMWRSDCLPTLEPERANEMAKQKEEHLKKQDYTERRQERLTAAELKTQEYEMREDRPHWPVNCSISNCLRRGVFHACASFNHVNTVETFFV